ncbi:MAG: F0F1 ATP synthase subunit epsilon [Helicobacter sp.]|nr:F0F1 ATP synthase subunit epsilon [Helicobacter sp.]MDE5816887.1 F0F1 ATP synthase subunit epsilon [Helicobacter sp.]MDE7196879.1 F0F1 ATP synthase subunit epsilon [Helicobacter sp.]
MEMLQLDIITPEGGIFSGKVKSVVLPGVEGEFGVLPGHTDVLTLLQTGVIEFESENGTRELVAVDSGYVKVDNAKVDVLANGAVALMGDNDSAIVAALDNAKKLLEKAKSDSFVMGSVISRLETGIKNR